MGAWNLVRAFIHSFNHGYELVFELRMIQCIVPLCFAALVVVIAEALKVLRTATPINKTSLVMNHIQTKIPYFQSLNLAPDPTQAHNEMMIIYVKDTGWLYYCDGEDWKKFEKQQL